MDHLWRAFLTQDTGLAMLSSLVTGALIGLEREVRSKAAGLRTHALVCFASTLVMLAAARQADWHVEFIPGASIATDPTRMAHGVLTGIGFLCAGVIFRQGPSVHGLTTAASLWMTASLGMLYGMGLYWLAVLGAAVTLAVLVLLRLLYAALPRRAEARLIVTAGSDGFGPEMLRALLRAQDLPVSAISQSLVAERRLELTTRTWVRGEGQADALAAALRADPTIRRFTIALIDDDAAFDPALRTGG